MSTDTAYRTTDATALAAYREFQESLRIFAAKRKDLIDALGRNAYVNRGSGFGSTRIVAFERLDGDKDGDLINIGGEAGALIVSSARGGHGGRIVPNLRRKAGKAYEKYLREFTNPGLDLPGMSTFHVYSRGGNMYMAGPELWEHDGALYALWPCADAPHEETWEQISLSVYYAAKEQSA